MPRMPESIYIIGAGGHGKVAIAAARASRICVAGVFDDDTAQQGRMLLGVPVLGNIRSIMTARRLPALIAIGDNRRRLSLAEELDLPWATVVHPAAYVDPSVAIGKGTLVLARAVIQVDALIGEHAIVNDNATVEHDCRVGAAAHVACGACLAGGATVGQCALVGAGAVLLPGVHVGNHATVGAGAVVVDSLPNGATAVGVPARMISGSSGRKLDAAA
ncbi:MAG: acetyltransferase [Pirellulales bacterium]